MLTNIENQKNEVFALECIKALFSSEKMSERLLNILLDKEMCCSVIGGRYRTAILKEVQPNFTKEELQYACKDGTNQPRFLKTVLSWSGRYFVVTNYWYGPNTRMDDNRTPFLNWINKITD